MNDLAKNENEQASPISEDQKEDESSSKSGESDSAADKEEHKTALEYALQDTPEKEMKDEQEKSRSELKQSSPEAESSLGEVKSGSENEKRSEARGKESAQRNGLQGNEEKEGKGGSTFYSEKIKRLRTALRDIKEKIDYVQRDLPKPPQSKTVAPARIEEAYEPTPHFQATAKEATLARSTLGQVAKFPQARPQTRSISATKSSLL